VRDLLPIVAETTQRVAFDPPLSDAQFEAMALQSDFYSYERTREGEILMHSPTGAFTGDGNSEVTTQLRNWWKTHRRGRVFDSSTNFFLPDGSCLSPDASYVLPLKLKGLTKDDLTGFARLCPDFIIELRSASDRLTEAHNKMERWLENGAALAWLIDPYQKQVSIYEPGQPVRVVSGSAVQGSGPVDSFILDLDEVWRCYEV
jgi:Uma2 family endonuclease